ncbi:hypothetical protein DJ568_06890 [Mucilaginibacter hurinus]|uniref:Uncharacterized protein n=1 Tax=Mucilaginibacter hurinus TaxID=2201324 RepID=A0A367GQ81_9SPHI|nr:hypothetical protein [Mucilaginibacter hurinus]RCH55612.1 hypothetical protein DJ568_06890 [Mucilaginibacter hurinus]
MRRFIILAFIAMLPFTKNAVANDVDPVVIRQHLITALKSSKTTDSLFNRLDAIKNKTGLVTGYIATLQALKAIHAWNPYNKIKHLNRSEKSYRAAVAADPTNIEVRFMRFSVEHNVPGFLGYNKNLANDRQEIITQLKKKNYAHNDHAFVSTVVKFLLESKRCTPAENEYLTKLLANLK